MGVKWNENKKKWTEGGNEELRIINCFKWKLNGEQWWIIIMRNKMNRVVCVIKWMNDHFVKL